MLRRKISKLVFPLACSACLAAGHAAAGQWIGLPGIALVLVAWLLAALERSGSFSWVAMILSVGVAAGGLFASVPFLPMLLAATFALAGWDTVLFTNTLTPDLPAGSIRRLEQRHYRSLIPALGLGLLAAVASPAIRLQIPFGWMLLLAILALLGLEGVWRRLSG
jgi:hypothetical protein